MATDLAEFEARYGFNVQQFVNLCAVGMLKAPGIEWQKAELAAARKAVVAMGDQDKINAGNDNRRIQDLADAVNLAAAKAEIVHNWGSRMEFAEAFRDGKIPWEHFTPYFGNEAHQLIGEGLIDGDQVLAAVRAA